MNGEWDLSNDGSVQSRRAYSTGDAGGPLRPQEEAIRGSFVVLLPQPSVTLVRVRGRLYVMSAQDELQLWSRK